MAFGCWMVEVDPHTHAPAHVHVHARFDVSSLPLVERRIGMIRVLIGVSREVLLRLVCVHFL